MPNTMKDKTLNVATMVLVITASVLGIIRIKEYFAPTEVSGQVAQQVPEWEKYSAGTLRIGNQNAAVSIVEFSDFQCPYCKLAAADIKALRKEYGESISWTFRHVPLHGASRAAAAAAECAARYGAFEQMHDRLFELADSIGLRSWSSFARESGIRDTVEFGRCMIGSAADSAITRDSIAASTLGIRGTPTFLINQRQVSGNVGISALRKTVQQVLPAASWHAKLSRGVFSAR